MTEMEQSGIKVHRRMTQIIRKQWGEFKVYKKPWRVYSPRAFFGSLKFMNGICNDHDVEFMKRFMIGEVTLFEKLCRE